MTETPHVLYNYEGKNVRTVEEGGRLYISLSDIAKSIGMASGRITRTPCPSRSFYIQVGKGGRHPVKMVDKDSAFSILYRSRMPEAREFLKWLKEILGE